MRAPACASGNPWLSLSNANELTGLRIFSVQSPTVAFPMGLPRAIVNFGRTKAPSCSAHLSVGSVSACANTVVKVGGLNSPGAQQWVFEDAGKSGTGVQLVFVHLSVGWIAVCDAGCLAAWPVRGGLETACLSAG